MNPRWILVAALWFVSVTAEAAPVSIRLSDSPDGRGASHFACRGRIYANVTLPNEATGHHTVEASWVRPDGDLQEKPSFSGDFVSGGGRTVLLWLEFRDPSSVAGASDDRRAAESVTKSAGEWRVEIRLDDAEVAEVPFEVSCP